jgi:hypothetical protein
VLCIADELIAAFDGVFAVGEKIIIDLVDTAFGSLGSASHLPSGSLSSLGL